jgi:CBS domain-containing protein
VTVNQLLETKGSEICSVTSKTSAFDALKLMADNNIGAVLVIEEGKLVGIFSERDYARNSILKGNSCVGSTVGQLMTREVYCVCPSDTIEDCMKIMTAKHFRHLPVLEDENLVGILTLGDVVKHVISDREYTIQELEKYISGSGR